MPGLVLEPLSKQMCRQMREQSDCAQKLPSNFPSLKNARQPREGLASHQARSGVCGREVRVRQGKQSLGTRLALRWYNLGGHGLRAAKLDSISFLQFREIVGLPILRCLCQR